MAKLEYNIEHKFSGPVNTDNLRGTMGLNVWMRDDIRNVLLALELTSEQNAQDGDANARAFHAGFRAALIATGIAFGFNSPRVDSGPTGDAETAGSCHCQV